MNTYLKNSFAFVLILLSSLLATAQTWPFRDANNVVIRGSVSGVVGEFRKEGNSARFHGGIDFTSPLTGVEDGQAVFSMHAGTAYVESKPSYCWDGWIRIRLQDGTDVYYKHIKPTGKNPVNNQNVTPIANNTPVQIGTFLGIMYTEGACNQHVHINQNSTGTSLPGSTNFINRFVNPFEDNGRPEFIYPFDGNGTLTDASPANGHKLAEFWRNGHTFNNETTELSNTIDFVIGNNYVQRHRIIYGKVDIVSRLRDQHITNFGGTVNGNNGINSVSYEIINSSKSRVGNTVENINFSVVPPNDRANYVFDSRSTLSQHVYIITNNPTAANARYDQFWNTQLRINQTEDWDLTTRGNKDARSVEEAAYVDGKYTVRIRAKDITNYAGEAGETVRDVPVVIDNFLPYVKSVEVRNGGQYGSIVYLRDYTWNATTGRLAEKVTPGSNASPLGKLWVKVTTSEPLQSLQLTIDGNEQGPIANNPLPVAGSDNKVFIKEYNSLAGNGNKIINITGADMAGNQLLTNPVNLPVRNQDGNWPAGFQGTDQNSQIVIGTVTCGTFPGGRTTGTSLGCIFADFTTSKTYAATNTPITFNPIASGSGILTYSWDFGAGATPATSTSSEPVTVIYSTAGDKTVSLTICDATTICAMESRTAAISIGASSTNTSQLAIDFTASRLAANIDEGIQLTSTVSGTVGAVSYSWTFDNGSQGIMTAANPVVSYNTPGNKTISLVVTDAMGSVTKVKTSYLSILSPYFNVSATISGCTTTDFFGNAYFSAFIFGGNPQSARTYMWNFGDGTTSLLASPSHTYKKPGIYTVGLTVCDATSCGTTESLNCVTVPSNSLNDPIKPDFLVENILFGSSPYSPLEVGLNTPVSFVDVTTGGGQKVKDYYWDFDSPSLTGWGSEPFNSSVPSYVMTKGPHEVYFTSTGNKVVYLRVSTTGPGSELRTIAKPAVRVSNGKGSGRCFATLGTATVTTTCWNATNPPQFSIPVSKTNCPIAKTEVEWDGYILPDGKLDFNALSTKYGHTIPAPTFPITTDFKFYVYQFDGISYNRIGYKRQRFTIYGPAAVDAGPDQKVCVGSSVILGTTSNINFDYKWTSTALNLLSSSSTPTPLFTGIQKGTYTFALQATDKTTGCVGAIDNVSVSVDKPIVNANYFARKIGVPMTISPSTSSGFGGNSFAWSPTIGLNDATAQNPEFIASVEGDYSYSVTVTDQQGCQGKAPVFINVSDKPGETKATPIAAKVILVTWLDRSDNEIGFLIERSVGNNSNFNRLAAVGANVTSYEDTNVQLDIDYFYRVVALLPNGNKPSVEFAANTGTMPKFTLIPIPNEIDGELGDFDGDLDLDVAGKLGIVWNTNGRLDQSVSPIYSPPTYYYYGRTVADFDNDNDLDIFNGDFFRNNNGSFAKLNLSFGICKPLSMDYNGDNSVDILRPYDNARLEILRNDLNYSFNSFITSIVYSDCNPYFETGRLFGVVDFDNDGLQDIAAAYGQGDLKAQLIGYYNSDGSLHKTITISGAIPACGNLDIGDINNDGKMDIIVAGTRAGIGTSLFLNTGTFPLANVNSVIPNLNYGAIMKFGDMDGDGDLDLLAHGNLSLHDPKTSYNSVYLNSNGSYSLYFALPVGSKGRFKNWIDVDNDGDLDIIGDSYDDKTLYINNLNDNKYKVNTKPTSPKNLCTYFDNGNLVMSWSPANDSETPSAGLTYNVYVKRGSVFLMAPMANLTSGFRKVAQRGNVDHNTSWTIKLPPSIVDKEGIEWGVQAIDNQMIGSPFSSTITSVSTPGSTTNFSDFALCGPVNENITYLARTITAGDCVKPTVIAATASLTLTATASIKLLPGFSAPAGAQFNARIIDGSGSPCMASNGRTASIAIDDSKDSNETGVSELRVYPNPTYGVVTIEASFPNALNDVSLEVVSMKGIIIISKRYESVSEFKEQLDLAEYSQGIYLIRLVSSSRLLVRKVIKI
jgi:PKD repeat protein